MRLPTSDPDRSTTRFMRRVLAMTALFATLPGCPTPLPVATHWIGINEVPGCVAPDACPCPKTSNPKDWEASRLLRFEPEGAMGPVELPRNLMKYCLYEWKHRAAPTAPPDPDPTLVTDLIEDRPVTAAQSSIDELADTLRQDQRAAFIPAARSFAGPLPGPAVERTAVAHLDTAPDAPPGPQGMLSPTSPGRDDHGFVMRSLLQDLVCDGNNCLADIRSWLALPNINDHDVDYVNGGSYGRRGYLAQKLFAAVETWKIEAARGGPSRLVIPLALGWAEDPHIAPADSSPTKAVFDTLFHADCHGVLVLAAAGTGTGGKSPASGPLLPAAWESTVVRPDIKACDDAGDLPVFFKDATLNREYLTAHPVFEMPIQIHKNLPIVLSVGGIDYSDRPIAPTRPRSLTNLVALGSFGGGTVGAIPLPQSRTGTSIAVMVAGAAAAAMWAYLPSLTGAEIEDWLLLTRLPLPPIDPTQDVCAGSGCAFLGRLSFCESLARVLHLANRAQPACVHLATPRANPSPSPLVINRLSALRWPSLTSYLKPMTPGEQSPGADAPPWVYPQPTKPGCTICLLDVVDKKLYGAFDAVQPNDLTLVVDTTQGLKTFGLSGAGNGPFSAEFNDLDLSQWQSTARTAWLTWTTNNADTGVSVAAQEQIPLF